jgi:2-(1,2-epoxy-1,2-dihydrophenyl)acetyl-CoA isomerase
MKQHPQDDELTPISYANRAGAAWITLSEPERGNTLHPASVSALLAAVRRARSEQARVIVLASSGRFFCVGGDLESFHAAPNMEIFVDDLAESLHRVISELMRSEAVVVSVVQGPAAGAGVSLAAAADVVVAASSSSFTLAYTAVGLSNDGGSSLLVHSLGLHRVLRMALLNDQLNADEAREAGLVARVVPDIDLRSTAEQLVASLLDGSASAYAKVKRLIRDAAEPAPEATMRRETFAIREAAQLDGREGIDAFMQKRSPSFDGPGDRA